jgi:hypothetical protein
MIVPYATFLETRKRRQRARTELPTTPVDIPNGDDPATAVKQEQQALRPAVAIQQRPAPAEKC